MRNLKVLLLLLTFPVVVQAQEITIEKKWYGTFYEQEGERLNLTEIQEILQSNEEAFEQVRLARKNYTISNILSSAGSALLGYATGAAISGENFEWGTAGIGAGLVAFSIPFDLQFRNLTKRGIDQYNAALPYQGEPGDLFNPKWRRPISFGLRLGVNRSYLNYNVERLKVDPTFGFAAGAFVDLKLFRSLHIQPEGQYSREGGKDQALSYFNVPVLLKWYFIPDTHINFGPQFGFLLEAEHQEEIFKSNNFSLAGGVGYETPGGFLVDFRGSFGINSVLEEDYSIPSGHGYLLTGMGAWANNIQFSIGYKL